MPHRAPPPIEPVHDRAGARVYLVRLSPEALPPVRTGDLARAWDVAREAAAAAAWGEPHLFRFRPPQADADADPVDLALADRDAACWAHAVDATWGLNTPYGLSLCLRLLGLVALLSGSPPLRSLCALTRAGAALDPALLRVAATAPLSARGDLDERRILAHLALAAPFLPQLQSGATL